MTVLCLYWYLPVSALYVTNSNGFCTTYNIDVRLDVRHRARFTYKELINIVPVIDTEPRGSVAFRNYTHGLSPCARGFFDDAISFHALNTCINNFLCSWICSILRLTINRLDLWLQGRSSFRTFTQFSRG